MFDNVKAATDALLRCCNISGRPIAQSEVYNETWLLRLVLAKLYDTTDTDTFSGDCAEILKHLHKAVRIRWISEGGLRPTLEKEGTTWTDAILGNVTLRNDPKVEIDSGSKRGVGIVLDNDDENNVGVIVVEAKVGSKLASGTSNHKAYNQAARNIACLARLIMDSEAKDVADKCRFVVMCPNPPNPRDRSNQRVIKTFQANWNAAKETLEKVSEIIERYHGKRDNGTTLFKEESELAAFKEIVGKIVNRSQLISWESIIKILNNDYIQAFYQKVLDENRIGKGCR